MRTRVGRRFRNLQWKLTLSYTLVSLLVWSVLALLMLGAIWWGMETQKASLVFISLQSRAQKAVPLLKSSGGIQRATLEQWLQQWHSSESSTFIYDGAISILDRQGTVLASVGSSPEQMGSVFFERLTAKDVKTLQAQLRGTNANGTLNQADPNNILASVPIVENQQVYGALVVQAHHLRILPWLGFGVSLVLFLPFFLSFLCCAAIAGVISGALTSRRLLQRFHLLSQQAGRWSQGDFASLVQDRSEDELGQLSRRFNMMAEQLQDLVQTRQALATSQERVRLARDLHDSVKQQIFALYLHIKGTKSALIKKREDVLPRLEQAEVLIQQVQEELAGVIQELRPTGLTGKTLSQALQHHLEQWSAQTGIPGGFQGNEDITLPPAQEEALYRLFQEALANSARHSQATTVLLKLEQQSDNVCLSISDNGRGFDVAARTGKGLGLLSMRERVQLFGGQLRIQSHPRKGTTVKAAIPLSSAAAHEQRQWKQEEHHGNHTDSLS